MTGARGALAAAAPVPAEDAFSLFDNEEAVIARADAMQTRLAEMAGGVKELAGAYRRGTREQRRLVRLSDRMQRDLQSLNEALSSEIDHRRRLESELRRLADTDALTGAMTRRCFLTLGERAWRGSQDSGGTACALMLDLDRFKTINDRYGHAGGDAALVAFAEACRANLRGIDLFGRMGGEEFAVVLVDTGEAVAREVAERLRRAVAALTVSVEQGAIPVSVSVGFAAGRPDESLQAALMRADAALYAAKAAGRDRVRG
ncbi:MAG: GGDEF domain-containing protein, partial [Sphingomonas sp.]